MIGKKNIAFGFLYLVITAALGPYMVVQVLPQVQGAQQEKKASVGKLQQSESTGFFDVENAMDLAKANTAGILALNKVINTENTLNEIKGGPHTHGNLESVLNILGGLTLCFLAVGKLFKQVISWLFILGALLHSGMLYLLSFGILTSIAGKLLFLGPWLVLLALFTTGIAAIIGFRGEIVRD
jgi:hypothetical protein